MKAKILLLLAAVTASSIVSAQFPMKTMLNQKKTTHNQITKALSPTPNVNTDQQLPLEEVNRSTPIIIDYSNNLVPREANDDNIFIADQQIPVPAIRGNQIYDFGNLTYEAENFSINTLVRPPRPHMSGDRTSWQIPGNVIDFNGLLVDTVFIIYETNSQGLFITKIHFTGAKTSLKSITGVVTDSLIIPEQTVILTQISHVQEYPTTYKTQWVQDPGKTGPTIFISLASEGLDHARAKIFHEHYFVHKIVGWGKIRVPTANGPSKYFECLLDKVTGPNTFSIYVNGMPASGGVSTIIFGNPNYKQTTNIYQYNFLKKGFWDLGAEASLDMDPTFSTVLDAVFDQSYLDIDCAGGDGVKMCLKGHINCVPYAHNLANDAMLKLGATLGSCNNAKSLIEQSDSIVDSALIKENNPISQNTQLKIYPNPFSTYANISFSIPQSQKVSIEIFDMMGRLVKTLVNVKLQEGTYQISWNVKDEKENVLDPGVYILRFNYAIYSETKKLFVVK